MPPLGHVKHTRGLEETELVLTMSVLLCLLWGLAEAEPMLAVSVSLCQPWGTLNIPGAWTRLSLC